MSAWDAIPAPLAIRAKGLLRELMLLSYAPTQKWRDDAAGLQASLIDCPSCHGEGTLVPIARATIEQLAEDARCPRCKRRGTVTSVAQPHPMKQHHHDTKAPPPSESLYEHHIGIISPLVVAGNAVKVEARCVVIQTDLDHYRGLYRAEVSLPGEEDAAMKKVVEVFDGRDPIDVARALAGKVSPGWVEKARIVNRRNPQDGKRLKGWRGWSDDERLARVKRAVGGGLSIRGAAAKFGAPTSTLHERYGHHWKEAV
jgi:hypothetical protein